MRTYKEIVKNYILIYDKNEKQISLLNTIINIDGCRYKNDSRFVIPHRTDLFPNRDNKGIVSYTFYIPN